MAEITMEMIKKLREWSGAGIMDCKTALKEHDGDMDKAMDGLQKARADIAARKAHRETKNGMIGSYLHVKDAGGVPGLGVMVEVNIETDFAARNDAFKKLVNDICLHIAIADPRWLNPDEVPEEELEKAKEIFREELKESGKPEKIWDKIMEGKIAKYLEENCLTTQEFALAQDKSERKPIADMVKDAVGVIGENITIRRFARMELGG